MRSMLRLPLIATAFVVAAILVYWGAGEAGAARKLGSLGTLPAKSSYAVTLAFPPERFHQLRLQDVGRVVEVKERTVYLMDVTPAALHGIAREYWVDAVDAWAGK
jgi:hypothetical protein